MDALRAIYGVGTTRSYEICETVRIDPVEKIKNLTEEQLSGIRDILSQYTIEGDLRREISLHIKHKLDLGCYQGIRHRKGLPVHGQKTKTNARTRKGKKKPVRK